MDRKVERVRLRDYLGLRGLDCQWVFGKGNYEMGKYQGT